MFTGIVQATGMVRSLQPTGNGARLLVDAPDLPRPIADGASICVSGVCLTVIRSDAGSIEFDVVGESLSRSTLGSLAPGSRVNLERSLRAGDGLDGHMVQGHVDGTARIRHIDRSHMVRFAADDSLMPYIIPKGSIAIEGVSLTIADVADGSFRVALIPTTLAATTLGSLRVGDRVNIETDILARTIVSTLERWRAASQSGGITMDLLREQGYA
jgi:riboflavin synthase